MGSYKASRNIIGMRVDYTTYERAAGEVLGLARAGRGGYVCVATVHMAITAYYDPKLKEAVNSAALVTPDGMPLVWGLKLQGIKDAQRVYGPNLTLVLCEKAAAEGVPVGFYGGTEDVLRLLAANLKARFPGLNIAYMYSPPFRPLTKEEDEKVTKDIMDSGARILFVGIGCPKQEMWMAGHRDKIAAVSLGVGAAFDFIAGVKRQAPKWMQDSGLEWLFRLIQEPRRLWKRYIIGNALFIFLVIKEVFKRKGR